MNLNKLGQRIDRKLWKPKAEKMPTHTPHMLTPWKFETELNRKSYRVRNTSGLTAAECVYKEHASHIVTCVNDYDRLKRIEEKAKLAADALETIQKRNDELSKACHLMIECIYESPDPSREGEITKITDTIKMEKAWEAARQAIIKIGGK